MSDKPVYELEEHPQYRLNYAYFLSFGYGLLQAGGTAGYILLLLGNEVLIDPTIPDGETHTVIDWSYAGPLAALAFVSVLIINSMLVREDLMEKLLFNEKKVNKDINEKEERARKLAKVATVLSALVLGLITACGLLATIDGLRSEFTSSDDVLGDNPKAWVPIVLGFTATVAYAEYCLMVKPMEEVFVKMFKGTSLLPNFTNADWKAKPAYYFLLGSIIVGVLGTALICTPRLATWFTWLGHGMGGDGHIPLEEIDTNLASEAAALGLLVFITLTQVPLYMDRAKKLIKPLLSNAYNEFGDENQPSTADAGWTKKDLEGGKKNTFLVFWPINAAANAPLAFLGVGDTIALMKGDDISGLAFFDNPEYLGGLFIFLAGAFIASMTVNSQMPPQAPDVETLKRAKNASSM